MTGIVDQLRNIAALGGPVVLALMVMSLIATAIVLAKLWQFHALGVGRHAPLGAALDALDAGTAARARSLALQARSHLAPLVRLALDAPTAEDTALRARLTEDASRRLAHLAAGLALLDSVAQVAPLLGLFGTVLGMIEAFQGLQAAGTAVDPSALAGGIWVALLTTAVGLAVAMPAALILTWFDGRIAREGRMAERIIATALCRGVGQGDGHD